MLVKQLDHLNLTVHHFKETVQWYFDIFEFELVEEGVQDGQVWGVLRSQDAMLCIYEDSTLHHLDRFEMRKIGKHHLAHFGFRISNQKEWESKIEKFHLKLLYGGVIKWPHSLAWYIKDPTGWEIEIVKWENETIKF